MSAWHVVAIVLAGMAAGTINTVVGSGTLITFPTLLAFGYAPVTANVSNTIGLVPGAVSGAFGYRRELVGQRARIVPLGVATLLGGTLGSILLLILPASAFKEIVPFFIALAVVMIVAQKQITRVVGDHRRRDGDGGGGVGVGAILGSFLCGIYGGYFGAAQGILMLAILTLSVDDSLQRLNAVKVITTGLANLVAGVVFVVAAHVAWDVSGLIAAGSVLGGVLGSRYGRRLPPSALRAVVVVVGIAAIVYLV